MKKQFLIVSIFLFLPNYITYAQNIVFSDTELKNFLLYANSVDSDSNNLADLNINTNNDNEIQRSELEAFDAFIIGGFSNGYAIKSIQDLSGFNHIKQLTILHNDSLTQITNLNLDSLDALLIGSCSNLKHIDLSDLSALTYLRIEDIYGIDYLNIKNGSFANRTFSLFYSDNIQYACVDSIAAEYNRVQQHMALGKTPSLNCLSNILFTESLPSVELFPNPTSNDLQLINAPTSIKKVLIYGTDGKMYIPTFSIEHQTINTSQLPTGIYTIQIFSEKYIFSKKFIKQ